ncbi:MAG: hypothetical protein V3V02_03975 [Rhizobiaceae bacterium]
MYWHQKFKIFALLAVTGLVTSGCVTGSTDAVLSSPANQAITTGTFPTIGEVPQGQTTQITPAEKAATKAELNRDAQKGNLQAAQNNQADYNRELNAMRKHAADQRKKRLAEIESRNY